MRWAVIAVLCVAGCELVLDLRDDYFVPGAGAGGGGGGTNIGGSSSVTGGGAAGSPSCMFAPPDDADNMLPASSLRGLAVDGSGVYVADAQLSFVRKCPLRGDCSPALWNKTDQDANMEPAPTALTLWRGDLIFGHGAPSNAVSVCDAEMCSSVNQVFGAGMAEVTSLAVAFIGGASEHAIFWTHAADGIHAVGVDSLPSGGWSFASGEPGAHSLVADEQHNLYWATWDGSTGWLKRCAASSVECTSEQVTDLAEASGLAYHAGRLYFTSTDGRLASCEAPGCGQVESVTDLGRPTHIAVDDCAIYWLDGDTYALWRCPHGGERSPCENLTNATAAPLALALGPDRVYWTVAGTLGLSSHPK